MRRTSGASKSPSVSPNRKTKVQVSPKGNTGNNRKPASTAKVSKDNTQSESTTTAQETDTLSITTSSTVNNNNTASVHTLL